MSYVWIITVPTSLILITTVMSCLCWRKKRQKSDWLGLDGMVTHKNPDENVNHLPSVTVQSEPDSVAIGDDCADTNNARNVPPNSTRRSLPDIPLEGGQGAVYEAGGDNSSIYATVEPYSGKLLGNGIEARPSISQHSSISQADDAFSPYARVNYDKLRKKEHPYARVQSISAAENEDENSSDEPTSRSSIQGIPQVVEPIPPPRSRRSSDQSVMVDIPAATAVAGGIAANQELPYMTPPITQTNFSGDSQDSSKGYTSISVREPLATIRAQTKELKKSLRDLDPHYSTVSDDSDEVYTTIQDPNNQLYTSGSETYAQIQPLTVAAEINPSIPETIINNKEEIDPESAPQPPSVDSLKNVAHSRQASSSSSVANIGSPKPEKRQANSPLPPPPPISPDLYASVDKTQPPKNLDDMYAKVQKNRKKSDDLDVETVVEPVNIQITLEQIDSKPVQLRKEHNYETLKKSHKCSDPGYEKLKLKDEECSLEPGYASINGPDSLLSSDPGYEVLKQRSEAPSEVDPNYEELRLGADNIGYSTIPETSTPDGYSIINKQRKSDDKSRTSSSYDSDARDLSVEEPNYESMPSESLSDHNYAALKSTESENDLNYETVNQDNNYESVKYQDVFLEPAYERLNDDDSNKTDSGYEKVEKPPSTVNEENEPPYQSLKEEPGYERINNNNNVGTCIENSRKESIISSDMHDSDEDAIFQV